MTYSKLGRSYKEWPFLFITISALSLTVLFSTLACSRESDTLNAVEEDQQTLFSVADIEVSTFEFNQAYLRHIIRTGTNDTKDERLRFLARWKENLLLANKAIVKGYTNNPSYLEATEAQKRKTTADTYFVQVMNDLLPEITDDELRLAFAKAKRKVYPRQLYATTKEALVPYYNKLEEGADFIKLANEFYNTTEYDSLAGSLGEIGYYSVDDVFAEKAFSLNQGEYSEPFQSKLGWHIIWIEHIIFEAMLAEDEYQIKREGTLSKYRTRRANLFAGDYIKEQMQQLNVEPSREGILTLKAALEKLAASQEDQEAIEQNQQTSNPEYWNFEALTELENGLNKNLALASYELNGEVKSFTVANYLSWLPYLSANESKARTGASVGRAIRNEYFYQKGLQAKTDESFEVQRAVRNRGLDVLSQLYQKEIINQALQDTSSINIPNWFIDRLYPNQSYEIKASYAYMKAQDAKQASRFKQQWDAGSSALNSKTIQRFSNQQLKVDSPLFVLVSKALLNQPMVAKSKEYGWIVLQVDEREFQPIKSENLKQGSDELMQQYRAYSALQDSLNKFNSQTKVKIDSTVFNKMYELDF